MGSFKWSEDENHCFGCGRNPYGLGLKFKEDGQWVIATTNLSEYYQGFQNIAHGGIVAVLLDEAAGWAIILQEEVVAPSYDLNLKLVKPVPLGKRILIRGKVKDARHGIFVTENQVLNSKGVILAAGLIKSKAVEE